MRRVTGQTPAFSGSRGFRVVDGALVAFDLSTLAEHWRVPGPSGDGFGTQPLVVDGHVIIATHNGTVLALRTDSGQEACARRRR